MGSDSKAGRNYDLSDYTGKSGLSSLADVFDGRMEQTVGGATIGIARDVFGKPENAKEKIERAQENDMATQVAADTFAIIPKFRALPAGLVRASLLVNPHQNMTENAAPFALNLAEGVALNQVGKMMVPGSRVQTAIAANIANPLGRELAMHLSVGAGFGAVKSGFNTKNWTDEKGNFAPGSLALHVLKDSATGAALNVPAGLVGVRVMKGSMALMTTESQISQRVATTIAAAGSGYTSGAVFGGIDAVQHHKSLSETLSEMHFAGKVGLVTGTAVGAFDSGALNLRYRQIIDGVARANTVPVQELPREQILAKPTEKATPNDGTAPAEVLEASKPQRRSTRDEILSEEQEVLSARESRAVADELDYQPRIEYRIADIAPRLKNPRVEVETIRVLKPDAKTKFDSFQDYLDQTVPKEVKMRVYDVEGHSAQLRVQESLAKKMEAVRNDRAAFEFISSKDVPYDNLPRDQRQKINLEWPVTKDRQALLEKYMTPEQARQTLPVLKARLYMLQNRVGELAVPEDFVVLMDEVPNRKMVKRIDLFDEANPEDPWSKQKFDDPNFVSAASASKDGTISFYLTEGMSQSRPTLRTFIGHEWAHLAANNTPEETRIYGLAALVDKDIPNPNYQPRPATASGGGGAAPGSISPETTVKTSTVSKDKPTVKYFAREYATKNSDEDGAVHLGEEMLAPQSSRLLVLADNAPVRTVVLSKSLTRAMASAPASEQSVHAPKIWQRVQFVEKEVYPEAMKILEKRLKTGSPTEQAASAELLGHLGDAERHLPMLRKLATDRGLANISPEGVTLGSESYLGATENGSTLGGRKAVTFAPRSEGRSVADIAFDAMLRLHEGSASDQLAFLTREAMPNSQTRELAQTRLGLARDPSAPGLIKLTDFARNPDRLPELLDLMHKIPDSMGKEMVFAEALSLGASNPEFVRSVIAKALEIPGLASKALDFIKPEDSHYFEPELKRLSRRAWDKPAQDRALKFLQDMPAEVNVQRAVELMQGDNPRGVQQGIEMVITSRTPDKRVIEPLLEVAENGSEANSRAARQALKRFSPQLVKFYAHALKQRALTAPDRIIHS